jgi:hypothetical protein
LGLLSIGKWGKPHPFRPVRQNRLVVILRKQLTYPPDHRVTQNRGLLVFEEGRWL